MRCSKMMIFLSCNSFKRSTVGCFSITFWRKICLGFLTVSYTHLFKNVADIQTADMLKLPVPEAHYHNIALKPSEYQKEIVASLAERAEKMCIRDRCICSAVRQLKVITSVILIAISGSHLKRPKKNSKRMTGLQ